MLFGPYGAETVWLRLSAPKGCEIVGQVCQVTQGIALGYVVRPPRGGDRLVAVVGPEGAQRS
jgi:hypothetical protein